LNKEEVPFNNYKPLKTMNMKRMGFKKIFFSAVLIFISIAGAYSIYGYQKQKTKPAAIQTSKPSNYAKDWKTVEDLAKKGLNKSAQEVVAQIYKRAKAENNAAQIVKAIIHRMKFKQMMEEYSDITAITELKEELKTASFPLKPVLQSMLAQTYWNYFQNNRYRFYQRTTVSTPDSADISTWDLKTIFSSVLENYNASLTDAVKLKTTKIDLYDEVLTSSNIDENSSVRQSDTRKFRPTLYDFIAHRALEFYKNEERMLMTPAYKFELDDAAYFSNYNDFSKMSLVTKDSLSTNYYALKIMQELLRFHSDLSKNKSEAEALVNIDLERLKFVKDNSTLAIKDSLYLTALQNSATQFSENGVSAEINYEIAQVYADKGNTYKPFVSEGNKWMNKKAFDLCEAVIKKYPQSDGAKNCIALKAELSRHKMTLVTDNILSPDKPALGLFTYSNLKRVYFRVIQLKTEEEEMKDNGFTTEILIDHYSKFPAVKEWSIDLPDDRDFQSHATEIKIPELPVGRYALLMGSSNNFSYKNNGAAYVRLSVSGISYVVRQMPNGGFDCYVQNRETGVALKGVQAQLFYDKYDYQVRKREFKAFEKYVTDENGYFSIVPAKEYRSIRIDFSYNGSTSDKNTSDFLRVDRVVDQYERDSIEEKAIPTTFFFLDRGIYRPGQTIYFKGILVSKKGESTEILPHTNTKVTFVNANQETVSTLDLVTNEYGTFQGSFTAPVGTLNGIMSISNESGRTDFSVEDYKRPKFEVTFRPVKENFRLNEQLEVTGKVNAFSGASLDGAKVTYEVYRAATPIPFFRGDYFKRYMPARPEMQVASGTATTTDSGSFTINFKAIADAEIPKSNDPKFTFTISAHVTDINGETQNAQKIITVGYEALNLNIDLPETMDKTVDASFPVRVTNMNEELQPVSCKIEMFRLKQPDRAYRERNWEQPDLHTMSTGEFEKEFPKDQYSNENDRTTWARGEKVVDRVVDSKTPVLKIADLKNWQQGVYILEAHCKDAFGTDVKAIRYVTVYSSNDKQVPSNEVNWFAKDSKKSYEPGDKATFVIGSKEDNVQVLYEVERNGVMLKKEKFVLNQQQKVIELPIEEKYRGGIAIHYVFIKNNRVYTGTNVLEVPYTNKELDIQFETFRNKLLPGEQEEWKLKIKDKKGDKALAEMVATLYDASLDQFATNDWNFWINTYYSLNLSWDGSSAFNTSNSEFVENGWNQYPERVYPLYEELNWFGMYRFGSGRGHGSGREPRAMKGYANTMEFEVNNPGTMMPVPLADYAKPVVSDSGLTKTNSSTKPQADLTKIATRKNFSETAFFYPQLETDKEGSIIIKFTIPESTTRWKMKGFAHTKDLKYGKIEKELVTQKELMVVPNAPRFFRENDKLQLTSKISNVSDQDMSGEAQLFLYDAKTMTEISATMLASDRAQKSFILSKGQNTVVGWSITIPENVDAITYKVVAKAGNFTDGEETTLPVLMNRMLVTESMPLYVNGSQTKTFHFEKFGNQNNGSATLRNRNLTLEFTSNPAWYAVQALPYLMEYPYDCSEQIFSKFYANSLATHIANSSPKIKAVFDAWKNAGGEKSTLLSNLDKNEELKSLLLEETPWVMEANGETERKKRIGLLFDLNKMSNEFNQAIQLLKKRQSANGSWPWFAGMDDDRYITQYIVTGIGHLDHLQVKSIHDNGEIKGMLENAVYYLDNQITQDYEELLKHNKSHMEENQLSALEIQYLYARSYFKDIPLGTKNKTAVGYYLKQAEKYWLSNSRYLQGMIALALNRNDKKAAALGIMKSLKENAITSEEMGMYWKENYENYYWYQSPIEAQALLIEAFDEVANDIPSVDALKIWLLRSKQTQNWKTTKATAEAVYALLLKGTDWLSTENAVEVKVGATIITADKDNAETKPEAGTGYFKTSWTGATIQPSMADVTITKKDEGISWGAMYWQYVEQLDKITPAKTPLQLKKSLFLQKNTDAGFVLNPLTDNTKLKVGDKIIVRIELRADRNMEYVHMKDMRASGLEPINVLSAYKYRDGLGYYESTRDAATNFFFGYLPKGTYVFEYPLVITHEGDFSNGVTSIQCMYAPEFTSHSEGVRILVGE
jgi:uncharacterized protein YfaS (alpha-2-macroglobulin family)